MSIKPRSGFPLFKLWSPVMAISWGEDLGSQQWPGCQYVTCNGYLQVINSSGGQRGNTVERQEAEKEQLVISALCDVMAEKEIVNPMSDQ